LREHSKKTNDFKKGDGSAMTSKVPSERFGREHDKEGSEINPQPIGVGAVKATTNDCHSQGRSHEIEKKIIIFGKGKHDTTDIV
jgi:hypothetical protein